MSTSATTFANLPKEIREQIYARTTEGTLGTKIDIVEQKQIPMIHADHYLWREWAKLYYSSNTFIWNLHTPPHEQVAAWNRWISNFRSNEEAGHVRNVHIDHPKFILGLTLRPVEQRRHPAHERYSWGGSMRIMAKLQFEDVVDEIFYHQDAARLRICDLLHIGQAVFALGQWARKGGVGGDWWQTVVLDADELARGNWESHTWPALADGNPRWLQGGIEQWVYCEAACHALGMMWIESTAGEPSIYGIPVPQSEESTPGRPRRMWRAVKGSLGRLVRTLTPPKLQKQVLQADSGVSVREHVPERCMPWSVDRPVVEGGGKVEVLLGVTEEGYAYTPPAGEEPVYWTGQTIVNIQSGWSSVM